NPIAPGRHDFRQSRAFVFLVFDDQYLFVAHWLGCGRPLPGPNLEGHSNASRQKVQSPRYAAGFLPGKLQGKVDEPPVDGFTLRLIPSIALVYNSLARLLPVSAALR